MKEDYSPETNPKAVFIVQDPDGNWRAKAQRFGKLVEVRDYDPIITLQKLLTSHEDEA